MSDEKTDFPRFRRKQWTLLRTVLALHFLLGTGCITVKPWQRQALADAIMQPDRNPIGVMYVDVSVDELLVEGRACIEVVVNPSKDALGFSIVNTKYPELAELIKQKSLRWGTFILASGKSSNYYVDGKLTSMDPAGAACIADAILREISGMQVDAVGGMDMGATPIIGAVACSSYHSGRPLPTFIVRKDVKSHGTMKLIEGPIPDAPCNVVVVDDVVTTGDSILKAIDAVTARNINVVLAISVLDRNAGASEALNKRGIPYHPLVRLHDIGVNDGEVRSSSQVGAG